MRRFESIAASNSSSEMDLNCLDIELNGDHDLVNESKLGRLFPDLYSLTTCHQAKSPESGKSALHIDFDRTLSCVAVAFSDHTVSVLDAATLNTKTTFNCHRDKVTGLCMSRIDDNHLVTCSLDGAVRHFDLRTGKLQHEQYDDSGGARKPLTCVTVNSSGQFVCAGTELIDDDVFLVFWDVRRAQPLGGYWESHSDEVTQVRFHASKAGSLCSSSTDGLVNIYDVRQSSESEALLATLNCDATVDNLQWCERSGASCLAALTTLQSVQLWDIASQEQTLHLTRHQLCQTIQRTKSELCYTVGCHVMADSSLLVLVQQSGGCLRAVCLNEDTEKARPYSSFRGANSRHLQDIQTSALHGQSSTLVLGGYDGSILLYTLNQR